MSAPSSLTVAYPPSFQNSFWSYPSYRRGAQTLYARLQAGIDENESILALVAHRTELEYNHAEALATPAPLATFSQPLFKQSAAVGLLQEVIGSPILIDGPAAHLPASRGYYSNDSATSQAFRLIQAETTQAHAQAHGKIAKNLESLILNPFTTWSSQHRQRIAKSWEHVDATLTRFDKQKSEVERLKTSYESKCKNADEAEDDARFAPIDDHSASKNSLSHHPSPLTSKTAFSPSLATDPELTTNTDNSSNSNHNNDADPEKLKRHETLRKQFGFPDRSVSASFPTSPEAPPRPAKEFAGVKLPPLPTETESTQDHLSSTSTLSSTALKRSATITSYLSSAVEKMPAPLKAAVGGVVSNEPRHIRLRRDADNAERVYEEAVRNLDRTRCQLEEVLYNHYGMTQKWESDRIRAVKAVLASYNAAISSALPSLNQSADRSVQIQQGLHPDLELRAMIRKARTGPFQPAIERFQPYYHDEISLGRAGHTGGQSEAAAWMTKNGGFGLDLVLVERLEYMERLEKSQAGQLSDTGSDQLFILPPVLESLLKALERAYADDDRWPPAATESEAKDSNQDSQLLVRSREKRQTWVYEVPLTVTHRLRDALIATLSPSHADMIYGGISADDANGDKEAGIRHVSEKMLDAYDPPVLAACIKLWLLELEKSLVQQDLWDQVASIYAAAAGQEREALEKQKQQQQQMTKNQTESDDETRQAEKQNKAKGKASDEETVAAAPTQIDLATLEKIRAGVLEDLGVVLNKLPKIHLACLDAVMHHLYTLVQQTKTDEPDLTYLNKLGLGLGRAILWPPMETAHTMSVRHPTLLVMDLIQNYQQIFPPLVQRKMKESNALVQNRTSKINGPSGSNGVSSAVVNGQRSMPIRKRTKPVDQRISRSSIGRDLQQGAKKFIEQFEERVLPKVPGKESAAPTGIITKGLDVAAEKHLDDEAAPTPLADRVLSHSSTASRPPTLAKMEEAEHEAVKEQEQEEQEEEQQQQQQQTPVITSPPLRDQLPSLTTTTTTADVASPPPPPATVDEDKPLSNVARLSRQFASGSFNKSAPRGPRPAGARSARLSLDPSLTTARRESSDSTPLSAAGSDL